MQNHRGSTNHAQEKIKVEFYRVERLHADNKMPKTCGHLFKAEIQGRLIEAIKKWWELI
ncbi:hypothetical protein AB8U03_15290 [Clostridium sp. Mt-5]|uniref:Uncharacterized protein n=1 Tax=Clostridium moutaii TaxID=3240932 RepID=A0ABV4BRY0_9CLOT